MSQLSNVKSIYIKFYILILLSISTIGCITTKFVNNYIYNKINLRKTIVYSGAKLSKSPSELCGLGFSHLDVLSVEDHQQISNSHKYILWTGIAFEVLNSPWARDQSPYNNDLVKFKKLWKDRLDFYKKKYDNPSDCKKIGIIVLDIESRKNNKEIELAEYQKNKGLLDAQVNYADYKYQMAKLYNEPLQFAKKNYDFFIRWSAYDDVPIERTWWHIPSKSWQEWISQPESLNYITHQKVKTNFVETPYAATLDFYSVSTYYFYSTEYYSLQLAGQYLAYMLFQIEVNKAYTKKSLLVYQTFRYQGEKERNKLIDETMVRNSVVFALISGADGIILHDDFKNDTITIKYSKLFSAFTGALANLNRFQTYFLNDKNTTYFKPTNARDLFVERRPIVRGIENKDKLLLAATNPFAHPGEETNINLLYKGNDIKIKLTGQQLYLGEIKLTSLPSQSYLSLK